KAIKAELAKFCQAVERQDYEGIIRFNYDLHSAIAAASHNRCIERGYRQMLVDKLRIAQHGLPNASRNRGQALAERFAGTVRISRQLVEAIAAGDGPAAEQIARELNQYVRGQVIAHFSVDLAHQIHVEAPPRRADVGAAGGAVVQLDSKPRLR